MLHKNSFVIAEATFKLTQQLQGLKELAGFVLVGGTSLALQIGHRNSIDIDLFTHNEFEGIELIEQLSTYYTVSSTSIRKNTVLCTINEVKVDFIRHNYPYVLPPITEEGITFLSKEDIAAMKLNTIMRSGKRMKDFIDLYYLLEYFSMEQIISFFELKYANYNPLIPLKAVTYFDDIDENIDPPKLLKPLTLDTIKNRITDAVVHSKKIF